MYGVFDSEGGSADAEECEKDAAEECGKPGGLSTLMRRIVAKIEVSSFHHGHHMQDCLTLQIS